MTLYSRHWSVFKIRIAGRYIILCKTYTFMSVFLANHQIFEVFDQANTAMRARAVFVTAHSYFFGALVRERALHPRFEARRFGTLKLIIQLY